MLCRDRTKNQRFLARSPRRSQSNESNMLCRDKRAVSAMIGYILLISAILATSVIVYSWLKTYTPTPVLECPDGVSIYVKELRCDGNYLNFTIKNNGRFSVGGYFIHATVEENQDVATEDLSEYSYSQGEIPDGIEFIEYSLDPKNDLKVNLESWYQIYDLTELVGGEDKIYTIEILPWRYQLHEGRDRQVTCSKSKIRELIECPLE